MAFWPLILWDFLLVAPGFRVGGGGGGGGWPCAGLSR
jgi:hypothetical protein